MKLEESTFLTSDYTTKVLVRKAGIDTGTGTQTNGARESPGINPSPCGHFIFDKGGASIQRKYDIRKYGRPLP